MKKSPRHILAMIGLGFISFSIESDDGFISLERALEMIKDCQIATVSQSHNRVVTLVTFDGRIFQTTTPELDEIFYQIDQLGQAGEISECQKIALITE